VPETVSDYVVDLKSALAKRRQQAQQALRVRFCVDRDLVDQHQELTVERAIIVAGFDRQRKLLVDDDRLGGSPASTVADLDRQQAEATADVDARIAGLLDRGRGSTVDLVFRIMSPAEYQDLVNQHTKGDRIDGRSFGTALCTACFQRAEQNGETVDLAWPDLVDAMSFGELDSIQMQVLTANRGQVATPF